MKKLISNRLTMYGSVLSTLNSNTSAWNNVPAFVEAVAQFTQKLADFRTAIVTEDNVRNGVRSHRDVSVNGLKEAIIRLVRALQLLGTQTSDAFLLERYRLTPSAIRYLSFRKLDLLCAHIDEDLASSGEAIAQYGISSEHVEQYQQLRSQLDDLATVVRDSIIVHSGSLHDLKTRVGELNALLQRMDKMVLLLKAEHPRFAEAYRMSRHVLSSGTHHSPPDANNAA